MSTTLNTFAPGFEPPSNQDVEDPEITRLRSKNELWQVYAPEWELYLSAYEGGPDFANERNLFRHQRENEDDFRDRAKRLHYYNYCERLVDFFTNFIFAETIQRDGGTNNGFYQEFITDVNKKGDAITEYMRAVSDDMQVFGMSYTQVDTPARPVGTDVITKAQEEEMGIRPYWILIKPTEVTDWDTDDFNNVTYAKRTQYVATRTAGEQRRFEKYTEMFPFETVVTYVDVSDPTKVKITSRQTFPNKLGKTPLVLVRFKASKRHPFMGNSFLRDFAYNNREVMNYTSLLQEFLYRQAFNILAKETDTGVPTRDQEDGNIGTSNVLEYPRGAKAPSYLSPPAEPAQFIKDERSSIIQEMFRRAAQDTLNELSNGSKRSGFSQAQGFSTTVPFIASRADVLEKAENELMTLTMKFRGLTWDGKVKYKDRYELTNIQDALSQLVQVFRDLMFPSETFAKEELKRLVQELDGKLSADILVKITKEIDEMDFKDWQDTQKLALIGSAGKSPAAQAQPKQTGTMAEVQAEAHMGNIAASPKIRPPKNKN